jgi:hypothetical protein
LSGGTLGTALEDAMDDNFWESLHQSFMQLRAGCAIDPPLNPAGRLTAIWTAAGEKKWRLNSHKGKDGNGVIERFTWAAESAAARLGFKGDEIEALSYWLDQIKAKAPESHIHRSTWPKGSAKLMRFTPLKFWIFAGCQLTIAGKAMLKRSGHARLSPPQATWRPENPPCVMLLDQRPQLG